MKKLPIVLMFVLAFVVAFYIFQFGPLAPVGYLEGKVTIGPFMPVEPSNSSSAPPEVYLSRYLKLKPVLGSDIRLSLNASGYFIGTLRAGHYTVTLTNCTFLGCRNLPLNTEIRAGEVTHLDIDIDTGIR